MTVPLGELRAAEPWGRPAIIAIEPSVPAWRKKARRSKNLLFIRTLSPRASQDRRPMIRYEELGLSALESCRRPVRSDCSMVDRRPALGLLQLIWLAKTIPGGSALFVVRRMNRKRCAQVEERESRRFRNRQETGCFCRLRRNR